MPCLQQRKTPRRLTSWTRCQASSEVSSTDSSSVGLMPALFIRTSIRPISSRDLGVGVADLVLVGDVGAGSRARPRCSASRSMPDHAARPRPRTAAPTRRRSRSRRR